MRQVTVALAVAVAICVSCGAGDGRVEANDATLRITTTGAGLVRGMGADCRGTCSPAFAKSTTIHFEAVPDSGAMFSGWSGACTGTSACEFTIDADAAVTATFVPQPAPPPGSFHLNVSVQGEGRAVSVPAGIDCTTSCSDCTSTCSATFTDGTNVSLTATSAAGSKFGGWSGACGGADTCSVTIRGGDVQVGAAFLLLPFTVSANATGPGQITGAGMKCGNGDTGCSASVVPGTVITLTATAAPAARFMGWSGACTGNAPTCQLAPQSDAAVSASFEYELQTLLANDGHSGGALALNSSSVFFGRWLPEGSGVWSVPKMGGAPKLVAAGIPYFIVADDSFVYWADNVGIYSAPVQGGSGALLATGPIGKMALDENGALYWTAVASYGDSGALHRMQDRVDAIIASGQHENGGVAVDADYAYFTCTAWDGTDRAVRRVPKKGGSVETLITPMTVPRTVRVDFNNVYYQDDSAGMWALSKSGGTPRLLSAMNGSTGWTPGEFDVNDSIAWWFWVSLTGGPDGLFRAKSDGTAFTAVDTSSDNNWFGPRVDDTAVYYFHGGALLRRLK